GGGEEREREGGQGGRRELKVRGGRAGDRDRLPQGNDDEELEALREVTAADLPHRGVDRRPSREPVGDERGPVVERERGKPECRSGCAVGDPAGDPKRTRGDEPGQDARRPLALD